MFKNLCFVAWWFVWGDGSVNWPYLWLMPLDYMNRWVPRWFSLTIAREYGAAYPTTSCLLLSLSIKCVSYWFHSQLDWQIPQFQNFHTIWDLSIGRRKEEISWKNEQCSIPQAPRWRFKGRRQKEVASGSIQYPFPTLPEATYFLHWVSRAELFLYFYLTALLSLSSPYSSDCSNFCLLEAPHLLGPA